MAVVLTDATEATPDRRDAHRAIDGGSRALVEHLKAGVCDLNVLRQPDFAVGVRGRTIAGDARKGNAVEVEVGSGHGTRRGEMNGLHDGVDPVDMCMRDLRVLVLFLLLLSEIGSREHVAQGQRRVVVVRGAYPDGRAWLIEHR